MNSKKISRSDIIGDKGIALIHRCVLDMGFVWNATGLEAGIDGYIEIRDETSGVVTNCILQVQSKATSRAFQAETDTSLEFVCDQRDLDYWLCGNAPVILVVSRPDSDEAYWISVKEFFQDPRRRKDRKVVFDKRRDRFDRSARENLAHLAIPKDAGVYLASLPRHETLQTNLLPIRQVPRRLFRASTSCRTAVEVWGRLRAAGASSPSIEWVLHDQCLYSFLDIALDPWAQLCDLATAKNMLAADWATSDDPSRQYVFVRLLNQCLRAMLARHGVRYSKSKDCYFFEATIDSSERKVGNTTVYKAYRSKTNPDRIAYHRHRAFLPQFVRFDTSWYLGITPSYYFTVDGRRLSRFYEERLSGIKMLERSNKTHLSQVRLWADLLTVAENPPAGPVEKQRLLFSDENESSLLATPTPYQFLSFDPLVSFSVDFGLDDGVWLPDRTHADESDDSAQWRLF